MKRVKALIELEHKPPSKRNIEKRSELYLEYTFQEKRKGGGVIHLYVPGIPYPVTTKEFPVGQTYDSVKVVNNISGRKKKPSHQYSSSTLRKRQNAMFT